MMRSLLMKYSNSVTELYDFFLFFSKNGQCLRDRLTFGESSRERLLPSSLAFLSSAY